MLRKILNLILISVAVCAVAKKAIADDVEVPSDELAQESVYPIFDNPVSVKNRNIQDSGTFDVGIFGGFALTEPIYNTTKIGLAGNYHLTNIHSIGLVYTKNRTGLSRDAQGIKDDFGLDYGRAPAPDYSLLADYNYKLFYGKLSLTKKAVMNTSIYFSGSAGTIKYVHKAYPALAVGVGERFYFNDHLSLKVDLRLFANQAPIPFKRGALLNGTKPTGAPQSDPVPSYDSFDERLTYTTNLEIGLNYLF